MKENLQRKVNLLEQNAKIVKKSAKLDFGQASNLGALLFTAENLVASERDIRANRKLLKQHTGIFNNMRGPAVNLALITRMCLKNDPEAYLQKVIAAYGSIKASKILKDESLVLAAMAMAESTDPAQFDQAAQSAWDTLRKMRANHPLLTAQDDLSFAYLLTSSGLDADKLLEEAETIYDTLKPTGFKLKKNTLQTVSIILAIDPKPIEEKCDRFVALREALRDSGRRLYGEELAIVAAFVGINKPIDEIVRDVADAADAIKHIRGFGIITGGNTRRMYASALVLQMYADEQAAKRGAAADQVAENVVSTVVFQIVMAIIMAIIVATCISASNAASGK